MGQSYFTTTILQLELHGEVAQTQQRQQEYKEAIRYKPSDGTWVGSA